MLFNSIHFIVFLPIVFMLYWSIKHEWRWILLLIASYYFYLSWEPWFGLLLLGTTIVDYYSAIKIYNTQDKHKKKIWLSISLTANLGCLAYFKYSSFFYNSIIDIVNMTSGKGLESISSIILPVGLSFYTFQSISYTIDVYRSVNKPETNLARFALYVSFFPQLVAGPVERFSHLMPQLYEKKEFNYSDFGEGIRLCIWGFFKKLVVADRLATFVDPVFNDVENYSGLTFLVAGFFFVVQLYCDFSGYTDIARGVAKFFGFSLLINFNRPLLSTSIRDFWKRHHISMTTWFRDYLYFSLGGNKKGFTKQITNIFIVFLISGLWHGAGWNFVLWGFFHALFFSLELIVSKFSFYKKTTTAQHSLFNTQRFLGWIYFLLVHSITLILFRTKSIHDIHFIFSSLFSFSHFDAINTLNQLLSINTTFPLFVTLTVVLFLFSADFISERIEKKGYTIPNFLLIAYYLVLTVAIFILGQFNANEFVYFQF
ncbi:MAG: MBOAT family protein [Bacteroidetes bacterium]|nr:MBOAT family protein [Bacteroidota bacterium]